MITTKEKFESMVPKVIIDPRLNQFDNKIIFPEKHAKAKETIARVGLPKRK